MAICGFASLKIDIMVDFPTFGYPTKPTSARSFNSNVTSNSKPFSPGLENLGDCFTGPAKFIFPAPPRPPLRITKGSFEEISAMIFPFSASLTKVPYGTFIIRSSALFPDFFPDAPF